MSLSQLTAWMPPSVKGDMSKNKALLCLQRKIPVKRKIFVIFSSLKSKVSPTQIYLNFRGKVWHCKLYIIQ
jgi:hypothetical protein